MKTNSHTAARQNIAHQSFTFTWHDAIIYTVLFCVYYWQRTDPCEDWLCSRFHSNSKSLCSKCQSKCNNSFAANANAPFVIVQMDLSASLSHACAHIGTGDSNFLFRLLLSTLDTMVFCHIFDIQMRSTFRGNLSIYSLFWINRFTLYLFSKVKLLVATCWFVVNFGSTEPSIADYLIRTRSVAHSICFFFFAKFYFPCWFALATVSGSHVL